MRTIGRACQMLVQTDLSMNHVAAERGFSDAAHLARQFRATEGLQTTRYRAGFKRSAPGRDSVRLST